MPEVVRLYAMHLCLHDIAGSESPVEGRDALLGAGGQTFEVVLTNPPFGKRQSYNVLFEGGVGETIQRRLLKNFDFHTLLRLPTGIFYKQGVKANVLFFDKHAPRADGRPNTKALWIYDLRTNKNFTLKKSPLQRADLDDFVAFYCAGRMDQRRESDRFKRFDVDALLKRDKINLDIFWLKDESLDDVDGLPPPDEIAAEIVENLQAALEAFQSVVEELSTRSAEPQPY